MGECEWAMVRKALDLQATDTVLDVGCGTGWFTRRAERVAARVVGVDIDAVPLDFARRHQMGQGRVHPGRCPPPAVPGCSNRGRRH
jgi:cyclopropane fatty-acyl-phospholipid synthase-like methyltransferase